MIIGGGGDGPTHGQSEGKGEDDEKEDNEVEDGEKETDEVVERSQRERA